jgi:urease accessory protein
MGTGSEHIAFEEQDHRREVPVSILSQPLSTGLPMLRQIVPTEALAVLRSEPAPVRAGRMRPGQGFLEFSRIADRTVATRAAATAPLKLLNPRRPGRAAWIYASTYGGGLVAGDEIAIQARLGPGARAVLGTQSATKVYKSFGEAVCRQSLEATVADEALLVVVPDPVICFAGARYEQRQRVDLHGDGGLVLVDWLTSGRRARGERWSMTRYRTRLDVFLDDENLLADAWLLDPLDGPLDSPQRFGRFHCAGLVVVVGRTMAQVSRTLVERIDRTPISPGAAVWEAASSISDGAVLRILGETPEQVGRTLSETLSFLTEILGDTPWSRKW